MKADLYFTEKLGYIPVKTGHPRVDGLGSGHGQNGIDGLYRKPGVDGEYVVIEVKSNDRVTSITEQGFRQMSDRWIVERVPDKLRNNREILSEILDGDRLLINYDSKSNGGLYSRQLNQLGRATTSSMRL